MIMNEFFLVKNSDLHFRRDFYRIGVCSLVDAGER